MILLLTGCINPSGMSFTALNNPQERLEQYIEAIKFYLTKTKYPIVFTENSGTDIRNIFHDAIQSGRMEYLFFHGNQNKNRGKGYGECEIIEYALNNSKLISKEKSQSIVKITGRLIVKNINTIIKSHRLMFSRRTVCFSINSDLSFPDSRLIIAPTDFYISFLNSKENINDSVGYFFEHALRDTLRREKNYPYAPFFIYPCIEGTSGSTGSIYIGEDISWSFIIKYAKYALSQLRRFNKLYRS